MPALTITALYVYPIKSCAGIPVNSALVTECGLQWDRHWLIVTACDRKMLTQRTEPALALVRPRLAVENDCHGVWVSAPGLDDLWLPDTPTEEQKLNQCQATVWSDSVSAADLGDSAAAWISKFLGKPARFLVKYGEHRPVTRYLPKDVLERQLSPRTAFADGFPFLLASEESLTDLNSRLESPVDMRRFRPNIVVSGCSAPFEEDTWHRLRTVPSIANQDMQPLELHVACRCTRCTLTNVDPDRGVAVDLFPLKELQKFRRVDPGAKYKACFGMNLIPLSSGQVLSVADGIEVTAFGEHSR